MYQCTFFKIHELVPPQVYADRGERAWELLDDRLLISIDSMRKRYGKMTINNYVFGGKREWSGLRTPNSPYYSAYSQHTFGRAADILFSSITAESVRQDMLNNLQLFPMITSLELDVSWVHIDTRNCNRIKTFRG